VRYYPSLGRTLLLLWRLTGILASVTAWLTIVASASINPWFNLWEHAFSDLGAPKARLPWVYNVGLMVSGLLACCFSLYLLYVARAKLEVFSSSLLFVAGIFLSLIGVFPSSTRPHTFVSTWFFIQVWLSFLGFSVASYVTRRKVLSVSMTVLSVLGPLGALLVELLRGWPSVALLEAYGIIIINMGVLLLTLEYSK